MTKKTQFNWKILIILSALLLCGALGFGVYNLSRTWNAGKAADAALVRLADEMPVETTTGQLPTIEIDGIEYVGIITLPTLGVQLPVINKWSSKNLRNAPCRVRGSAEQGGLVIIGYNYSTHFGSIEKLSGGDAVLFTDMTGSVFSYEVVATEALPSNAVEEVVSDQWDLTLFTSAVWGRTQRVIRCDKIAATKN